MPRPLRPAPLSVLLAALLAASGCQVAGLGPAAKDEARIGRDGSGRVLIATASGRAWRLRAADGRPLPDLMIQAGGRFYPMRDGKLALPDGALKQDFRVFVPGYVPRTVSLADGAEELVLEPIRPLAVAIGLPPAGGTLRAKDATTSATLPAGVLARPATRVSMDAYRPTPGPGIEEAHGVLLTVDGPIRPGTITLALDLDAMVGGWDGTGAPPWERDPAAWPAERREQAEAAARILGLGGTGGTFAGADGARLEGRTLIVDVPVGTAGAVDGYVRTDVKALAQLGVELEVTVVSSLKDELPPMAKPPALIASEPLDPRRLGGDAAALVAAGAGNLVAAGAGNLIGADGGSLVGMDGASLIGLDGGTLVGMDGATLIGNDGGSLVGMDGGSLVGMDAASLIGQDGGSLIGADGGSLIDNRGGALAGNLKLPVEPLAAKYRLRAFEQWTWAGQGRVRAVTADGTPLSTWVPVDGDGNYFIYQLPPSAPFFFVEAEVMSYRMSALAIAPGRKLTVANVTAATTAASALLWERLVAPLPPSLWQIGLAGYNGEAAKAAVALTQPQAVDAVDGTRAEAAAIATAAGLLLPPMLPFPLPAVGPLPLSPPSIAVPPSAAPSAPASPAVSTPATFQALVPNAAWDWCDVPTGLAAVAPSGLFVADENQQLYLVDVAARTQARWGEGTLSRPRAVWAPPAGGEAWVLDADRKAFFRFTSPDDATEIASWGDPPYDVAQAPDGSFYVTIADKNEIWRISGAGGTWSKALAAGGGSGAFADHASDPRQAKFYEPRGVAVARDGRIFVADHGNHRIRMIEPGGRVSTIAGSGAQGFANHATDARQARFNKPSDVTLSPDEAYLYVADTENHMIRRVAVDGREVVTVAGDPTGPRAGDGSGPQIGAAIRLDKPISVTFDARGHLWVGEDVNNQVRELVPATP